MTEIDNAILRQIGMKPDAEKGGKFKRHSY